MSSESTTLLIAFGGRKGALGVAPFEFFNMTGGFPVKRLFVRDLEQAWYHLGIPGYGETIAEVGESLKELVAQHEVERLVVAGTSAGGYAAMLFGTLLGADTALCFAPQTVLDLDLLASIGDHRWDRPLRKIADMGRLDPRWTDLREALPAIRCADTRYELYLDLAIAPDRGHWERVADLEGVELHAIAGAGHNTAGHLRNAGELEPLLLRTLGASTAANERS
jgi:dienelactone hydrolase